MARESPGRNAPCWCGSGRKYKKCHLRADQKAAPEPGPLEPRAREYWEILRSTLPPPQVRSDEVRPDKQ